jgi:arylsulfatase A-like enzyme
MNTLRCFVVVIIAASLLACNSKENTIEKPNVLFISIDDLNDWTGFGGGHPQSLTPSMDKFVSEAVSFRNAQCANPACNPSRTSVMTGYAPHTSGVYSNYQDWRKVIPERVTIGQYFRENGYYSAGAGKIFHYHMIDSACWDEYWPSQLQNMPNDPLPVKGPEGTVNMPVFDDMYMEFDWGGMDIPDSLMGDYRSVKWVSDKLKKKHDKPFFLACGIYKPHVPWYLPQKYFDKFPRDSIQLPEVLVDDLSDLGDRAKDIAHRQGNYHMHITEAGLWKDAVQSYLASVNYADTMLGMLMDALDNSPYADNTIVVIWSDHGWGFGQKEHWRKFALWDNITKANLIIRVPEGVKGFPEGSAREACYRIVSLQDIYPTLIDLCGLPPRNDIDGRSLTPLLRDPEKKWNYPAITSYDFGEFSIRTEKWRYIRYIDDSEELYDHENDPLEWYNLAGKAEYSEVLEEMRGYLPPNPAPLKKTGQKLESHHTPPFATKEEYQFWLKNNKSYPALVKEYWSNQN